jgi:heme oxygenase
MGSLIGGRLGRSGYVALMRNLHALYAALEAALNRHAGEPALAVLGAPHFHREGALASDLDALCGPGWRAALPLAPATAVYVARLQELADSQPVLLVAHAYVRYLGDLHGGQMLKRLVARSLAVSGEGAPVAATRFYEFGTDDEVLALRQAFRAGLARVAADAATADRLVAEARWAFQLHVDLFTELAAVPPMDAQSGTPAAPHAAANASA